MEEQEHPRWRTFPKHIHEHAETFAAWLDMGVASARTDRAVAAIASCLSGDNVNER